MEWPVGIFNPLIGFLLVLFSLCNTNKLEAVIMYGLEIAALIREAYFIRRIDQRCLLVVLVLQVLSGYSASGFALYFVYLLSKGGGFCMVGGYVILLNATYNMHCLYDVDIGYRILIWMVGGSVILLNATHNIDCLYDVDIGYCVPSMTEIKHLVSSNFE
jgi:hypothetical protein